MKSKMTNRNKTFWIIAILVIALFFTFNTLPMIKGVIYSFTNYKGYGSYFFQDEMYTKINPSYNLIELHSTAELLSPNLLIVDFRGKQKAS